MVTLTTAPSFVGFVLLQACSMRMRCPVTPANAHSPRCIEAGVGGTALVLDPTFFDCLVELERQKLPNKNRTKMKG